MVSCGHTHSFKNTHLNFNLWFLSDALPQWRTIGSWIVLGFGKYMLQEHQGFPVVHYILHFIGTVKKIINQLNVMSTIQSWLLKPSLESIVRIRFFDLKFPRCLRCSLVFYVLDCKICSYEMIFFWSMVWIL